MSKINTKLTIFFEAPYWVGIIEKIESGKLSTAKITFGAEPKDYQVYAYFNTHYFDLKFSKPIDISQKPPKKKVNPKRMQREINKYLNSNGTSTKSQEAIRLQHEENKEKRIHNRAEKRRREKEIKFEMRQEKKKKKKRGH